MYQEGHDISKKCLFFWYFFISWESMSHEIKKCSAGIALRWNGMMSLMRPAAGGESRR